MYSHGPSIIRFSHRRTRQILSVVKEEGRRSSGERTKTTLVAASATEDTFHSIGLLLSGLLVTGSAAMVAATNADEFQKKCVLLEEQPNITTFLNWSGTHSVSVQNDNLWEPESIRDVERIVRQCHLLGTSIRPIGSALSPNGLGFNKSGMMSMAHLDKVLEVKWLPQRSRLPPFDDFDPRKEGVCATVTVQAGARVSQVVDALRPYGLTLPNLASIAEQQMGGFVQVGAHGTGRCIAPMDHYVTAIKLVTPGIGTIVLSRDGPRIQRELFNIAKVGLGCLGIVVELTIECIPAHELVEHTFVLSRVEAKQQLDTLLKEHKHMRYMWIPYTDAVVVVTNDPKGSGPHGSIPGHSGYIAMTNEEKLRPLVDLFLELTGEPKESVKGMKISELRGALLAIDPLNIEHVKRCNQAEAKCWKNSQGYQVKPSDELLQFDCGGQV